VKPVDHPEISAQHAAPRQAALPLGFYATVVASTFLMGAGFIPAKLLLTQGLPGLQLMGWRFVVAALATLPILAFQPRGIVGTLFPPGLRPAHLAHAGVIGLLQTAISMVLLIYGLREAPASTAAILLFTNPIWVAAFGWFVLGERLSGMGAAGLLLGVAGVAFAVGGGSTGGGGSLLIDAVLLCSAFCWAGATIVNKRIPNVLGPLALSFWQMFIGAGVLILLAVLTGERWPVDLSAAQWGLFAWLAVPSSTGAFGLWFIALSKGGATRASSFLFLAPLFAVLLTTLVLGGALAWSQAVGGALICLALWLINRRPATRA